MLDALRENRSGLGPLTRFASPRCGTLPVAQVPGELAPPRTVALAQPAARQALEQADLWHSATAKVGLACGTCVGGMPETEEAVAAQLVGGDVDPDVWRRHGCGATSGALADYAGLAGPTYTLSTACSSGAQALATAAQALRAGQADAMLAGGVDAICRLTLNGFASLLAVSPAGCQPFDVARKGMSLGEAAAFLVLERESVARARGANVLATLLGSGNRCDAFHLTAPDPNGAGALAAMRAALADAGVAAGDVDYVNAHGTGTDENDRAEGRALRALFGGDVPPVSSTKRVFGHTLGAAGALEAIVSILALRHEFLPGTCGLEQPDPACEVEPLRAPREARARIALSNSFGFGGNNTVLVLGVDA